MPRVRSFRQRRRMTLDVDRVGCMSDIVIGLGATPAIAVRCWFSMTPGIHLLHKPVGPTSFSLVRSAMEEAGRLKVCHGGTLDPFAHGLLLLLVGPATRLFDYLHAVPKLY